MAANYQRCEGGGWARLLFDDRVLGYLRGSRGAVRTGGTNLMTSRFGTMEGEGGCRGAMCGPGKKCVCVCVCVCAGQCSSSSIVLVGGVGGCGLWRGGKAKFETRERERVRERESSSR
ncbi:hypothetical protein K504DRAFT_99419 [Pleomassaria siparia CBS 279.74]|uniref:Uncharacterized protein n=1 Tax=Pleomassaria siparia CBS 279.74 TaxID=1314801 RepID=A0A6G1JXH3_9PLEO|nr:hypothetical protein K504DRAFT_99419 [Pleomassaria siparia CBS 279.74]